MYAIRSYYGALAPAMTRVVRPERRHVDDGEFGNEILQIVALGTDQQLTNEKRMPGEFGVDAGPDPVFRVGAAIEILYEQFLSFGVPDEVGEQRVEILARHFAVVVPPDRFFGQLVDDRVLVLRRPSGVMTCLRAERAQQKA